MVVGKRNRQEIGAKKKKKKVLTDTENVAIAQEITCSYIDKFVAHR